MVCEVCVKCRDAGGGVHTAAFAGAGGGPELSGDDALLEGEEQEEEVAVEVSIRTREGEGEGVGCGGGEGEGISGAMLLAAIPRELALEALI